MRNRGRHRRLSGAGAAPLSGNDVLTVTDNGGGAARFTTAAPHGLAGAETIDVSGTSGGLYDGQHVGVNVQTATVFDVDSSYVGDATGGTWELV